MHAMKVVVPAGYLQASAMKQDGQDIIPDGVRYNMTHLKEETAQMTVRVTSVAERP